MTKEQLKLIRTKAGLNQSQLAKILGLSSQTRISEYENGKRNPSKRILILYKLFSKNNLN